MTKIENVFMLSINARLDYETLREVCVTGHSRVPIYEEIELPAPDGQSVKAKKIVGVLLVKQVFSILSRIYRQRSDSGPSSAFYSIQVTQSLCAVSRYIKYHASRRTSLSLVFLINSRKDVRTWLL